ncbi:unnamed protein product [Closterium sp. Naga37s-1]|nr:unnamed protein product [Closterium sp. Naga37s-1]
MAAFKAIDERSEGSFKEGSAKDRFRSAKSVKRGASPARPRQVDGIMHEYQMQNAAARRAEASNHSKKGIGGTVLFLMLLVCTAAVGWGGYQYKQALSLELRLSELQRKHTRLASKLSDDVPASVSRIFPSSSSSSSRCEVEGEDGAVEGTCSPFPTERSEGDSAGWREGSRSEEESDRERRSSKEKAKEKSKEKKEEEEEEEEVKEDQELFWRRVALLASILCLVLPIFIIRNIDEVAQLFGRRPKATDGHTTAAASSSSSSSTSAAAAAAAAAGAAPSAAPGADEEVSMSKRLAYKVDVLFSMHSWVKGAALLAATLLLIALGGLALYAVGSKDRMDLGDATWRAWSYVADAGNHADSEGVGPRIVGVSISIGGMLIFALMVGLVSEGISEKVDSLKKGKSDVIEKNHTLILGWSDKLASLLKQLAVANESMGGGVVVVMSEREKEEMESEIQKMEFNFRGTTVICRSGSPLVLADLKKVSVSTARALIVLAEAENADAADARALRVVLSLTGVREGLRGHIVVELSDIDNQQLVKMVGGRMVETVVAHDMVGGRMVETVVAHERCYWPPHDSVRPPARPGPDQHPHPPLILLLLSAPNRPQMVGGRMVETVVAHDVIGRLMIQCARQPGLAQIWETLLGFENCEFYTKHWPELVGKTFREVLLSFPDAVPCGLRVSARTYYEKSTEAVGFEFAGGSSVGSEDEEEEGEEGEGGGEGEGKRVHKEHTRLWLNPDDDYVLQPEDSVLVIAEDDDSYAPGPLPVVQDAPLPDIETPPKLPEKILFCGWRRDIDDMITVLEAFLARGSELWIFSDVPVEEREARLIEGGLNPSELENVTLVHRMGNAVIRRHLEFLPLETFDSILILADEGLEDSIINCDSRSLATLLLIRDIQSKRMPAGSKGHRRSNSSITYPRPTSTSSWVGQMQQASQQSIVISEILDSRTRSLVSVSKISDYVLSNELVSMALAMVAEDREVNRVLEELFSEEVRGGEKGMLGQRDVHPAGRALPDGRGGAVLLPSAPIYTPLHPSAPIRATPSTATRCTLGLRMEIIIGYRLPHQPPVHSFPPLCTPLHPSAPIQGNKIYIHPAELYLADGEELSFFEVAGKKMYIRPAELYLTDGEELSFFEVAVRARQHMEIIISSATGSSLSSLCTPLHPSIPLLSSFQGNEMYIRPAELYLTDGEELSFFEVVVRARQRMEIIIGYRLFTEDEAVLNPPDKAERRTWSIQDTFIVLSFNE